MDAAPPPSPDGPGRPPSGRPRTLDLIALTVGYGLAALLLRSFGVGLGPGPDESGVRVLALLAVIYPWLGLAMSGPVVLLLDRRDGAGASPAAPRPRRIGDLGPITEPPREPPAGDRHTPAERAWLLIGFYWMALLGLRLLATTTRGISPSGVALVSSLVGLFGLAAALRRPGAAVGRLAWTHRAAVALLVSWPLAWLAMILLSLTWIG